MSRGFQFQRREFKNGLTQLIQDIPNTSVYDFLCHKELSPAIRNEPDSLLNWLKGKDKNGNKRSHIVIEWALTKKHNTAAINDKYKIWQVNRNASNCLCAPSHKLYLLFVEDDGEIPFLYRTLKEFSEGELARDTHFAGHFVRIMEMMLLKDPKCITKMDWSLKDFVKFCLKNADIAAYQEVISHLPVDYKDALDGAKFGNDKKPKHDSDDRSARRYFRFVLRFLLRDIFLIEEEIDKTQTDYMDLRQSMNRSFKCLRTRSLIMNRVEKAKNPLDFNREQLPDPEYMKMEEGTVPQTRDLIKGYEERMDKRKQKYKCDKQADTRLDLDSLKARAYMLINSIQMALDNDIGTAVILQDPKIIKLLLMCGIYADDWSMISIRIFKLLNKILYGDEDIPETFTQFMPILEKYAKDFLFTEDVTPKMLAAFPIFWFYRYESLDDGYKYQDIEYRYSDPPVSVITKKIEPRIYRKPHGKTPLEFYGHLLLDEPAMSDSLNREIYKVLRWIETNRMKLAAKLEKEWDQEKTSEKWVKSEDQLFEYDIIILEFVRSVLTYKGKHTNLRAIVDAIPLVPTDNVYKIREDERYHIALNGVKLEVAKFLCDSGFYLWHGDMTSLCFDVPDACLDADKFAKLYQPYIKLRRAFENEEMVQNGTVLDEAIKRRYQWFDNTAKVIVIYGIVAETVNRKTGNNGHPVLGFGDVVLDEKQHYPHVDQDCGVETGCSFGKMLYTIITGKNTTFAVSPKTASNVPALTNELISKYWELNPDDPPPFEEILAQFDHIIENGGDLLLPDVDMDRVRRYISQIKSK